MNLRDAQILNARKKARYCNFQTRVHHNCGHGESLLSSERKAKREIAAKKPSREERILESGYAAYAREEGHYE